MTSLSVAISGSSVITGHPTCTVITTTNICSDTVFVGGAGVCRLGDFITDHTMPGPNNTCIAHSDVPIAGASSTVFANGFAIARVTDAVDAGFISTGNSKEVYAG